VSVSTKLWCYLLTYVSSAQFGLCADRGKAYNKKDTQNTVLIVKDVT